MNIDITQLNTKCHFKLDEFVIDKTLIKPSVTNIPAYIIYAIIRYYLIPLNDIRRAFGNAVIISKSSCYRPFLYELSKNRNGGSLHTFGQREEEHEPSEYEKKGACDVTVRVISRFVDFATLIARGPFMRICIYPENKFIHIDYNADQRHFFVCSSETDNKWKAIRFEQYIDYAQIVAGAPNS